MGFKPPWPNQLDVFGLLDKVEELGLDGVHLDAAAIGSMEYKNLENIKNKVFEKGLYIEFNWGLPKAGADQRLQFELQEGVKITQKLGADIGKLSLNLKRSQPVLASKNCEQVMSQLQYIAKSITEVLPLLEQFGIKLAIENHTDCYASEILWLLAEIDHPLVGACVDIINPLMIGEDPMQCIEELAPFAFTNHFRDSIIEQTQYGCRIVGCALGKGDMDLVKAYELLKNKSNSDRINIEIALDVSTDSKDMALAMENDAIKQSVDFCRNQLNIKKD